MNLTKVASYQTSDGKLHSNKIDALNHEYQLELIGFIRQASLTGSNRNDCFTAPQVATLLVKNEKEILTIMNNYHTHLARHKGQLKKNATVHARSNGSLVAV